MKLADIYKLISFALICILSACEPERNISEGKETDEGNNGILPDRVEDLQRNIVKGTPANEARIVWDHPSMVKITEECAGYTRIIKLNDGTHMAAYEACNGAIVIRKSFDGGVTWPAESEKRIVSSYVTYKNGQYITMRPAMPFICQLSDGTILCANNFCPQTSGIVPYSIAVCRSVDNGDTWTQREIIYEGGTVFEDGCWEPAILQLPDGEVHLYIANEAPYATSNKQEISFFISVDSGRTWTKDFKTASIRSTGRDGMPCPCIFDDEIVIIVEDIFHVELKPTTVRCKVTDKWSTPVTDNSPGRDYNVVNIPTEKYAGAPYIIKLPSGEAVISYQTNDNVEGIISMDVAIGDKHARNFGKRTQPFGNIPGNSSVWNSLCVLDDYTIGAVGALNGSDITWPILKSGHVMAEIQAEKGQVTKWPIYIGPDGDENLSAGMAVNDSEIIFNAKVRDVELVGTGSKTDRVDIYFDSVNKSWAKPYKGVFKISADPFGNVQMWEGNNGRWTEISVSNVSVDVEETSDGYDMTVKLNRSLIPKMNMDAVRVGFTLASYNAGGRGFTESVAYMSTSNPCSWLQIKL